jgi:hypothetical protein
MTWIPVSRSGKKWSEKPNLLQDFLDWRDKEWSNEEGEKTAEFEPGGFLPQVVAGVTARLTAEGHPRYLFFAGSHTADADGDDENFSIPEFNLRNKNGSLDDLYLINLDHFLRVSARFGDPIAMLRLSMMRASEHEFDQEADHLGEANRWYWRFDHINGSTHPDDPAVDDYLEDEAELVAFLEKNIFGKIKDFDYPGDETFEPVCELHGEVRHFDEASPLKCSEPMQTTAPSLLKPETKSTTKRVFLLEVAARGTTVDNAQEFALADFATADDVVKFVSEKNYLTGAPVYGNLSGDFGELRKSAPFGKFDENVEIESYVLEGKTFESRRATCWNIVAEAHPEESNWWVSYSFSVEWTVRVEADSLFEANKYALENLGKCFYLTNSDWGSEEIKEIEIKTVRKA